MHCSAKARSPLARELGALRSSRSRHKRRLMTPAHSIDHLHGIRSAAPAKLRAKVARSCLAQPIGNLESHHFDGSVDRFVASAAHHLHGPARAMAEGDASTHVP
jgi:hypothetical protein